MLSLSALPTHYRHLFFDLDHTLWDFDRNAEETLLELYGVHGLQEIGVSSAADFIAAYTRHNHRLWAEYHKGNITKQILRERRFRDTFLELNVAPGLMPSAFEDDYVRISPTKPHLFPGTHDVLRYLKEKYTLHLISNGFREATTMKVSTTGLASYFDHIIISEEVGINKPDPGIFQYALQLAGAEKHECLMIGDSLEADIYGALHFGMDAVYFNPNGLIQPDDVPVQITALKDLYLLL